ncbi:MULTISPECIES: hypothetical protein [unclassified Clostridium]|uniref:hypothetical protein n=2 Tax=Clostridium TaxID=1485 RepID=UPI002079DC22|nr:MULTISPECIES: hypothetical protein [unclassified Clostridium]
MDFSVGNLVKSVVGAVAKVATAVVNKLSPVAKGGGILGGIAGAIVGVAEAVLGVTAEFANAYEDGEIDDEEAEELLQDVFKLLVGAYVATFGFGSSENDCDDDGHVHTEIIGAILSTSEWFGYDHNLVQQYILNNKPNEFKSSINLQGEIFIPGGGRYGKDGRADIVDTGTGEIWEIKSYKTKIYEDMNGLTNSQDQLQRYIDNYPDGDAIKGKLISDFTFHKDDKKDIVVRSYADKPGMLYYWEVNRKDKQEQEQEQLETSTSNVPEVNSLQISEDSYDYPADHSKGFWEEMEAITGLAGAALVAYVIISEGSRLFPPRNLIPVP